MSTHHTVCTQSLHTPNGETGKHQQQQRLNRTVHVRRDHMDGSSALCFISTQHCISVPQHAYQSGSLLQQLLVSRKSHHDLASQLHDALLEKNTLQRRMTAHTLK